MRSLGLFRSSKLTSKVVVIALAAGLLGIGIAATSSPPPAAASTACSASAASTYTAGRGLVGDPYQIATSADLIRISTTSADWSGLYFVQTANIDLGSCEWPGIGTRSQAFTGTYDGGFYTVSGFRMTTSTAPDVGFFNRISQTTIRNLTIQGSITSDRSFVGGLVGSAPYSTPASTITQVNSKVDISYSGGDYAGGIVGGLHTNSVLSFSTHSGQLSSSRASAAGLTGYGEGIIESSYSRATFTGASTFKSGLNGWANPVIRRSYSVGSGANGGIAGTFLINSSTQVFWDTSIVGAAATAMREGGTILEATGKTTVEMKTLDTFSSTNFRIVDGWDTFTTASWSNFATTPPSAAKIWGICSGVNDGYPFLLWEYTTDPCTVAPPPSNSDSGSSSGSVYVAPVVVPEVVPVVPSTIRQTTIRKATEDKPARLLGRSLDKDVLFIADSAKLSPQAKKSLRQAARLAKASDGKVAVTGFAAMTNRGRAYEKSVAQKRALAVARYLRAQGFDDWIYYQGLSGRQGLAFDGDPRRVEIRILN